MNIAQGGACLSDDQISGLVEGLLRPEELTAAESHLAECGDCRHLVAAVVESSVRSRGSAGSDRDETPFVLSSVDRSHYTVGRELARGGMGRILEAWDVRHRRPVAIKVLLKPSAIALQRFAREARITARLQHPSIVPLYEAGLWDEGAPFFAMKRVLGGSLAEAFAEAKTLEARLTLLPNIIAVTEAVAYAHSLRIVHRDLKPGNVLLGAFGETVVIDWGLAKELDDLEIEPDALAAEARRASLTLAGHALGTPCYMPPEQARGEPVTPQADVYALGALLYHAFSGRPPFVGRSADEVLTQVLSGPPTPLAERVPDLAPDLLTIVEKAMALQPSARYASAKAMADDLKRYADGQLVSAHRYSIGALVKRWVGRHRTVVAMAAALVVAVALTAGLSVGRIVRERDRADALKVAADQERVAAVGQRDAAEELVDFMVGRLKATLETIGRLEALEGVGQEVGKYYARVSQSHTEADPAVLVRRAAALEALADVAQQKKNRDSARALSEAANELRTAGLVARPTDSDSRSHIASNLLRVAAMDVDARRLDDATRETRDALDVCDELMEREPENPDWQMLAAKGHRNLAKTLKVLADPQGALAEYTIALELARNAAGASPANLTLKAQLGRAEYFVAWAAMDLDDLDAAGRGFRASADVLAGVVAGDPLNATAKRDMSLSLLQASDVQQQLGNLADAIRVGEEAKRTLDELSNRDPENRERQRDALLAGLRLCNAREAAGLFGAALEACRAALPKAQRAVDHDPTNASARDDLIHTYWALVRAAIGLGLTREATSFGEAAVIQADALLQKDPSGGRLREAKGISLTALARAQLADRRLDEAMDSSSGAIEILEKRNRELPQPVVGVLACSLAEAELVAGDVARARGELLRARTLYERIHGTYRELVHDMPMDADHRLVLATVSHSLFEVLARGGAPSGTESELLDEVIGALEPLRKEHELAPKSVALLQEALLERRSRR